MGLSDVKLHRFFSVPDDILLCKREPVTLDKSFKLTPRDSGSIDIRKNSFKLLHMRSVCSSGTDLDSLDRLYFKTCASDIERVGINRGQKLSQATFEDKMRADMPVLRDSRNRRQAFGNILEDIVKEDFDNMMSMYENTTNTERAGALSTDDSLGHRRRQALADIFQGVSEDDLAHLMAVSERDVENPDTTFCRRRALADIFTDVSEDQIRNIVQNCQVDIESSRSMDDSEMKIPQRCRRCARANIFDDIEQDDIQRILQFQEQRSASEGLEFGHNVPLCRRFGLADIFHDVSEDDFLRIFSMSEEIDEENETDARAFDHRRQALADIFEDINENDLVNFLADYSNDCEESDSVCVSKTRNRRKALGDIFSGVDRDEVQNFLSEYDAKLEHGTNEL